MKIHLVVCHDYDYHEIKGAFSDLKRAEVFNEAKGYGEIQTIEIDNEELWSGIGKGWRISLSLKDVDINNFTPVEEIQLEPKEAYLDFFQRKEAPGVWIHEDWSGIKNVDGSFKIVIDISARGKDKEKIIKLTKLAYQKEIEKYRLTK